MRIIAGSHRGRKLAEYFCDSTRPTTDRVKENVFNVLFNLTDFDGISVLDLFAGTGQYGIECLSRGAKSVIFNDIDKNAVSVIKKNLAGIKADTKAGNGGNCAVTNRDYRGVLSSGGKFDLIFLDPPYCTEYGIDAVKIIAEKKLLKKGSVIVFETDKADLTFDGFSVTAKKYGITHIYFLVS
jgi:16S rRNA (guanine(966)-N(2))-methyltransferase RsmD